jgi:hypothetical protein
MKDRNRKYYVVATNDRGARLLEHAQLMLSEFAGNTSPSGRCSLCTQTFSINPLAVTDPLAGQRELRDVFDAHVKEHHSWRADANRTAAFNLRKMMEEFGS